MDAPPSPALPAPGIPSPDQILQQARGLLADDGARELQRLTLAVGLSAAQTLMGQLVLAAGVKGRALAKAEKVVAGVGDVADLACMRVVFRRAGEAAPTTAFFVLDACPPAHDLGRQLDRVRPHVSEEQWKQLTARLSEVVFVARAVYRDEAKKRENFIRGLFHVPPGRATPFLEPCVDPANTTLFLHPAWPERVGIFVRFEHELPGARGGRGPASAGAEEAA